MIEQPDEEKPHGEWSDPRLFHHEMEMTTPTPDDKVNEMNRENEVNNLSARLPELPTPFHSVPVFDAEAYGNTRLAPVYTADQMHAYAIAALSALPAAGTPVAWQYRYKDRAAGTNIYNTFRHPVEEMGHGDEIEWWVYGVLHTTPQPSAAECSGCSKALTGLCAVCAARLETSTDAAVGDYEAWAKQERQREDAASRLGTADAAVERNLPTERRIAAVEKLLAMGFKWDGKTWTDADVGAQGDGECAKCGAPIDPECGHVGDCAAPAAGKGVDEPNGWNIRRRNGGLVITGPGGMTAYVDDSLEQGIAGAVLHALAKDLLASTAALTRQPEGVDDAMRQWAQDLIEQLPGDHDGRNSWMLNHGVGEESDWLRAEHARYTQAWQDWREGYPQPERKPNPFREAALTRQPVAGDGWRPIESAPKDVDVLVYCPSAPLPHRVAMLCLRVNSGKTVWLDTNSDRLAFPPTHWQPLDRPTGPAQGDGEVAS